jgi:hypothetical protein
MRPGVHRSFFGLARGPNINPSTAMHKRIIRDQGELVGAEPLPCSTR